MFKQMAQYHGGGCIMIVKKTDEQGVEFIGSGFLCHRNGYILTCAHTINLTDKIAIIPPQPLNEFNQLTLERVNPIDVSVAQYDSDNDVALLKIDNPPALSLPENIFGNESSVQVGSSVGYLGFPFGQSGLHTLKISQSIISSKVKSTSGTKQFQLDAMIHEGNSGGPLIELASGKIIGIISGRFSPTGNGGTVRIGNHALGTESTISYATSINYALDLMKSEGLNV
ncbi:serine protease [Aeromonas sanarellii]|uniref:S1C family serine protease n=1 Tax=Aeromonas sanarellii TaxID=633415 RepID=UPI002DBC5675|nr:serine protease [Aeromonas sanarellii]MEB6607566.1 serine protease [Aeromonas sanarellii]